MTVSVSVKSMSGIVCKYHSIDLCTLPQPSKEKFPEYYERVSSPVSLKMIKSRIKKGYYTNARYNTSTHALTLKLSIP